MKTFDQTISIEIKKRGRNGGCFPSFHDDNKLKFFYSLLQFSQKRICQFVLAVSFVKIINKKETGLKTALPLVMLFSFFHILMK